LSTAPAPTSVPPSRHTTRWSWSAPAPVGLTLAIDLAQRGQRVLLLDNDHRLSSGSRAICFAKRTLEIWDRLGVGQRMVDKGVSWSVGRVFFGSQQVYQFDMLPEPGHERPAFINLQQYYAEGFLVERAMQLPNLEIRWQNKVTGRAGRRPRDADCIDTPDGPYRLTAGHVAACDGSRSPLRAMLGQESKGRVFQDRFLIADLRLRAELFENDATERWFWFDPPFHPGQSVLLHRRPTTSGAWTSSSAGTPTPTKRRSPSASRRVCRRCCARASAARCRSRWNGPASTPSPACAWTVSATAA
jgi:3-(3-hydroxy-phenyl)propionate hydroxylase